MTDRGSASGVASAGSRWELLQGLTARLARIVSSAELSSFVLGEGVVAIGAASGSLSLIVEDGQFELSACVDYPDAVIEAFRHYAVDASLPAGEAVLTAGAIYCESLDELFRRYPIFRKEPIVGDPALAVLPLISSEGQSFGALALGFSEPRAFSGEDREFLEALAVEASAALERARAVEALVSTRDQLSFLAEASERLAASFDFDETTEKVFELAVPKITDQCSLYLVQPGGAVRRYVPEGARDPDDFLPRGDGGGDLERQPLIDERVVAGAIRTGDPLGVSVVPNAEPAESSGARERGEDDGSILVAPLNVRGEALGALAYANRPGRNFSPADRERGIELARRAAVALDNARTFTENESIAVTLQHALLPELPQSETFQFAARYLPSTKGMEVGGDWFDVVSVSPSRCVFAVGDVAGHGIGATTAMAALRFATRAILDESLQPHEILGRLAKFHRLEGIEEFATVLVGELDAERHRLLLASAGHPPAVLLGPQGPRFLTVAPSPPIGVGDAPLASAEFRVEAGMGVIAYTDGLIERRRESIDTGLERLLDLASSLPDDPEEIIATIVSSLVPPVARDDTAVLAIRWPA